MRRLLREIGLFTLALSLAAQPASLERRAVDFCRKIPVSALEPGLPKRPLALWLTNVVGHGTPMDWHTTDCGEQSGNPEIDRLRDFPMCVEALARLSGDRIVSVSVVIGTYGKGISAHPQLGMVAILTAGRLDSVPGLRALPGRLQHSN